ncbi:Inhibitor of nuclear factor kappa-B kinase subunit beta-like protein [Hapsidospora chrysogenum ATCC 11550]|uniref:IkappaB kinase n=1 Tax=Hapsidospora chrysogenum (strain ATCC 11550 / CBS 779.69 / DSM 880 / IAM 14645 / JCM 23072 / IMI 49137) TaxID=857340 RepID=A0A086TFW3_HAPC1|nr:Inhibitor of nuclear factor kappa-B kinase subunit beta-like protein [Hapsidospora chrysogenum ATCC 11550]
MQQGDIVAYLYILPETVPAALDVLKSSSRYVPPRQKPSRPSQHSRRQRQSTEPPEDEGASSSLGHSPCLVVKFSDIPRTNRGLVFGSNEYCDVVVNVKGMSQCHFSLTFDEQRRLIVKDLGSLIGTQVTYDREGEGPRRQFQWIVSSHDILDGKNSIVIKVKGVISLRVIVPPHDVSSPAYIRAVGRFCEGASNAADLLDTLGLSKPRTRAVTGTHTPGTGEIHLRKRLGEGGFGVVTHLWNVSTGSECVVKEPVANAVRKKMNFEAWEREARIMGLVSHSQAHVVRLLTWVPDPYPQLYLEYVPGGSLDGYESITYSETLTILQQSLSALDYLHGRSPPIAHRDIKPANILVQYRFEGDIYVKLADFGVSKDSSELMTFCGTRKYFAPEVHYSGYQYGGMQRYTVAVDIWSLGVVACELAYGLPSYHEYRNAGVEWCRTIVKQLEGAMQKRPSGLGQFLLSRMLSSPQSRLPARECHRGVVDLLQTQYGGPAASTSGYPKDRSQQTTTKAAPATVVRQTRSSSSGNKVADSAHPSRSARPHTSAYHTSSAHPASSAHPPSSARPSRTAHPTSRAHPTSSAAPGHAPSSSWFTPRGGRHIENENPATIQGGPVNLDDPEAEAAARMLLLINQSNTV